MKLIEIFKGKKIHMSRRSKSFQVFVTFNHYRWTKAICFSHITYKKRWKLRQVVFLSTARFTSEDPRQTLVAGKSGILNCSAEGNPAPRFKWTRKGGKALDRQRFRQQPDGNMLVKAVFKEDGGEFICTIEQNKGTKHTTIKRQSITVFIIGKISGFR